MSKPFASAAILWLMITGQVIAVPEAASRNPHDLPSGLVTLSAAQSDGAVNSNSASPDKSASRGKSGKGNPCSGWEDNFNTGSLDTSRWTVASGQAPGYIPNLHIGYYLPGNVSLENGLLALTLNQQGGAVGTNPSGIVSNGGLI